MSFEIGRLHSIMAGCLALLLVTGTVVADDSPGAESMTQDQVVKSDTEWRELLSPEVYHVLREKGTERPFSGRYVGFKEKGVFSCAGCGQELFDSDTKFDSGTGWPSFWAPVSPDAVVLMPDDSLLMHRTEVQCSRCGGHLGHVFNDGPEPTGLRYCINSAALRFIPTARLEEEGFAEFAPLFHQ